jgi:hypothetical protein
MTPEINLACVPSDPKAALGYAELHALWKADEDAYNAGRRIRRCRIPDMDGYGPPVFDRGRNGTSISRLKMI